jgi:hypothetical protein
MVGLYSVGPMLSAVAADHKGRHYSYGEGLRLDQSPRQVLDQIVGVLQTDG